MRARVARSEWSGLSSHDIDVSPKGMGAEQSYQSVEVISKVDRTAVRRSLHRLVRSLWVGLLAAVAQLHNKFFAIARILSCKLESAFL